MSEKNNEKSALVPRRRFPEFREAAKWEEKALGAVCDMQAGKFVAASEISEKKTDGLYPCFGGNGLRGYTRTYNQSGRYSLIGRQGALCGNVNLVDGDFYATEHAVVTTPKAGHSTDWLFYNLCLLNLNRFATGQAQPGLSVDVLEKVSCVVPSDKDEQQKIADCLSSIDELITAETQKLDALKTHKKGLMQQLFPREGETVPRLRFPEFQEAGEWEEKTLGQIADFQSGGTPSKGNSAFWNGSIPWVSAKDMKCLFLDDTEDHITTAAVEDGAKLVQANTILMLTRGMTLLKDIPICVLSRQMSFNQDVKALLVKGDTDGCFLAYLLLGSKERLLGLVDVAGHGTGRLDTDELKSFELTLPQTTEQERIADCLSSLDDLITAQSQKIDALKTHKKGLMQQLFPVLDEVFV